MIYIVITTSINNKVGVKNHEHRETRYIDCISSLLSLIKDDSQIKPIIVENNGLRSTFLDDLGCDVLYTNNNNIECKHKGGNELLDIKCVIHQYRIQDDDTIIKLTGRYKILSLDFIHLVKNNCMNIDVFLKFFNVCTLRYHYNKDDCVLGLFAIKCKYLRTFQYNFAKSPEYEFAVYVKENINKLMAINNLHIECCFAGDLRILNV